MQSLLAVLLVFTFLAPEIGAAQSGTAVPPGVGDSTPVTAKVPCTTVPGGQQIARADTAETKNAAGAAPTALTGGGNCMPGMAMSPEQLKQMQAQMAQMGAGGEGMPPGAMAMSPEQLMKQMQAQMPSMPGNGDPQSTAVMQAMRARMAQMGAGAGMPPGAMAMSPEELMKQMRAQMGAAGDSMPLGLTQGPPGEGGVKALEVSSDLAGDLKKGKTVIRNIDWVPGRGAVSPAGADGFARAMAQVAAAMKQAGGSYRVDLYMDKQSGNVVVRTLGPQRLAAVQASLVEGGATPGADGPQIGKSEKDGDPRLEVVRLK